MQEHGRRRGSLAALTLVASIGIAVFFTLYSLVPVLNAAVPERGSLHLGTMMAVVMAVQPSAPLLVRRLSLRGLLIVSVLLLGAGALVTSAAAEVPVLLAGAVLAGAGFGTFVVAGSQGIGLLVSPLGLGRALGTYGLVTMIATASGAPLGVQFALATSPLHFGWTAFGLTVLAAGVACAIPGDVGRRTAALSAGGSAAGSVLRRAPWTGLVVLLLAVLLLSHGLASLPILASGGAAVAVVIFAVQAGNALGRWLGALAEERLGAGNAVIVGAVLAVAGGGIGIALLGSPAAPLAGALIGAGVGIVQTVILHIAMRDMGPGPAAVGWNLAVDGGLWAGGVLWGLALATGTVGWALLPLGAGLLVLSFVVARGARRGG